ncbi:hypothetical protein apy_00900 [Aeropyrum pernix]|uniref:Uncharacterized protein n=1 Tax=Aeropyrum pernix TaxID=56636 RepID=A0A401H7E4_AERPX|nr:hypothetical protein apy_00900 [Aeropyrum pernix]
MTFDFECITKAIKEESSFIGALVKCGVNTQAVDYASWLLGLSVRRPHCVEYRVNEGESLADAMLYCFYGFHSVAQILAIDKLGDE